MTSSRKFLQSFSLLFDSALYLLLCLRLKGNLNNQDHAIHFRPGFEFSAATERNPVVVIVERKWQLLMIVDRAVEVAHCLLHWGYQYLAFALAFALGTSIFTLVQ